MLADDPVELETVLAFFRKHRHKELNIAISMFEGYTEHHRLTVSTAGDPGGPRYCVTLISHDAQWRLEIELNHFSYSTVTPSGREVEIRRLMGGSRTFKLVASEIDGH